MTAISAFAIFFYIDIISLCGTATKFFLADAAVAGGLDLASASRAGCA